jgi:hypothetical protein
VPIGAELLTDKRVVGVLLAGQGAKDDFALPVGVSDGTPVALGPGFDGGGREVASGDAIDLVGEAVRQFRVCRVRHKVALPTTVRR